MPFFLILVVALLLGLTPTAGASVVSLSSDGTLRVEDTVDEINKVSISSTVLSGAPHIRVEDSALIGKADSPCTPTVPPGRVKAVSCPARVVRVVVVQLGDGDDALTSRPCSAVPAGQEPCPAGVTDLDYPREPAPAGEAFVIATGDAGNDMLVGGAGRDNFRGGPGDDPMIAGNGGNDRLEIGVGEGDLDAADGKDVIDGGPGDDIIGTGPRLGGPDTISGGDDNDRVDFSQRTQPLTVSLDGVADDGEAGEGDNVLDVEEVIGGSQDDTLIGSSAANLLEGRDGQDTIEGGAGDDVMRGGSGDDSLAGGDGNDKELTGGGGGDRVEGGGGNDSLEGGAGADALDGGDGDDGLNGGGRNLVGADGPDDLIGGPGRDILLGGRGNDRLDGGLGADYLSGESEKDTVTYEDRTNPVFVTLDGEANDGEKGEGDNVLPDVEEILGGFGGDDLYGNVGDNTVEGGTGEDLIDGKRSPDRLLGADASDLVMARDGLRDEVACGDGGDLVIADDGDKVIDCETVDRPRSRDAVLGSYALLSPLRPRRKGARVAQQQEAAVGLRLPQGGRFYPLEQFFQLVRTFQIPIGSTIKAEDGEVQLTTASDRGRGRKHVSASLGRFTVYQRGGRRAVTRLSLAGKLPDCGRGSTQRGTANVAARSRPRKLRTREKGKGKVEVEGKYSTGASYGTDWLTEDRCDGTLTTVFRGTVLVQDFGQKKKVVVRAGHSYLAKKP